MEKRGKEDHFVTRLIKEIAPLPDTLVQSALSGADYRDAFAVDVPSGRYATITDFARAYFLAQPAWLRIISMNQLSRTKMEQNVKSAKFAPGEAIGSWKIYARNDHEIVFGESLGFMTYRFSLSLKQGSQTDTVMASTITKINSRFGKIYFFLVRLLHKRFVRLTLRYAISENVS
ncbi:MAG: hypothetical protein A3I05_03680 [Deltaproteobacteria bacterium RIFCSPLOWO2_02_FULL_44_10]|nr:MAG: hypothetical protein A3C46_02745 [Deltaproteobacteria bacterium RIFCSPHIGHO2_02_FULL_44_16]OGQ47693.1 MAG: hypothetical protein A3I05_03680 [Deltaproteobacteria bacterium RIFCSPLOWO2_02_FULL_44_10]